MEKPILFNSEMINAILNGRKTQKRGKRTRFYIPIKRHCDLQKHIIKRLANGLDDAPKNDCWEWMRTKNIGGYGMLTISKCTILAHRLAYEFGVGHIPDGFQVLHKCDNPGCINPKHLFIGTQSDNMKDCFQKGRSSIRVVSFPGELNPSAKLTIKKVKEIKNSLLNGITQQKIADIYNVSQSQISHIKRGSQWK